MSFLKFKRSSNAGKLNFTLIKRIYRDHTKKYLLPLIAGIIVSSIAVGLEAYLVTLLKPIFDKGLINKDVQVLTFLSTQVMFIYLAKGLCRYFQSLIMYKINTKMILSIQNKLFSNLVYLDIDFYNKNSSGQIFARIVNDVNQFSYIALDFVTNVCRDILTFLIMFIMMVYYAYSLLIVILIMIPLLIIITKLISKKVQSLGTISVQNYAKAIEQLTESLQNIKVIKSYTTETFEIDKFKNNMDTWFKSSIKYMKKYFLIQPITEGISGIILTGIILFGSIQISKGIISTGDFMSFLFAWISAYKPLKSITHFRVSLQAGLVNAERVYEFMDTKPTITNSKKSFILDKVKGDIELKNISFAYENDKPILKNISLKVKAGSRIAFVGNSGGGKTTLINLIPRFFDTIKGEILIDGKNIKDITLQSLRSKISLVSQDIILFNDTVAANIAYGSQNLDLEKIKLAAIKANAHDFINSMPEGYNTIIGEKGTKLSGGQKQRISIARAIMKNAPIILLDEATSALDTESEFVVHKALDNLMENTTTIIIAHRLSTIKNADVIYVINKGEIVESGNHESLLKKHGAYYKLYNMQFSEK